MGRGLMIVAAIWLVIIIAVLGVTGVLENGDADTGSPSEQPSPRTSARAAPKAKGPVSRGVVVVSASARSNGLGGASRSSGSGFVVDRTGLIVTKHIGADVKDLTVRFGGGGRPVRAELVGADQVADLSLLRVDPADVGRDLRPIELSSSDQVRPGDPVVAISRPPGRRPRTSHGSVTEVGLNVAIPNVLVVADALEADVRIGPRDAGGPLLDERRRVIGVISQIRIRTTRPNRRVAVVVPVEELERVLPALERGRAPARAYLGASVDTAPEGGVAVVGVLPNSPAERDGLRIGDRIVEIAGSPIEQPEDVAVAITSRKPGERIEVSIERGGAQQILTVRLAKPPARTR